MIKYHEVIAAAKAGATKAELIEIAGGLDQLMEIYTHQLLGKVGKFEEANKKAGLFDWTYSGLLKEAKADLAALDIALKR